MRGGWRLAMGAIILGWTWMAHAQAQLDYESAPIHYGHQPTQDRVARLASDLESGKVTLASEPNFGFLRSLLQQLQVPPESQTLVFSKTSFQLHKIDPQRPRAVYFNDDTYVGWVEGGEVLELGSTDPHQGGIFYTLERGSDGRARMLKDQGQCLICHSSVRTQSVPGYLVRSVFSNASGRFVSGTPSYVSEDKSPFEERWGGWYVTGTHGSMRHLGNVVCTDPDLPGWVDRDAGANQTQLPPTVKVENYLRPSSDLIALMVMEHQTQLHNLITRASFEARTAEYQDTGINEALGRPDDYQSGTTQRRIANVGEKLLSYLLTADAITFASPIRGTSEFAETFSQRGPQDRQGRSLYQLDLDQRLFRHRCSYLIYSPGFDALPETVKTYLGRRMHELLIDGVEDPAYASLTADQRMAVAEILADTKTEFWQTYVVNSTEG